MDKGTMVGIDRTVFGKDATVRTGAGGHIREQTLVFEMLPVVIPTVVLVCLLPFELGRSQRL